MKELHQINDYFFLKNINDNVYSSAVSKLPSIQYGYVVPHVPSPGAVVGIW